MPTSGFLNIIKRNGTSVPFDTVRILNAIHKAFLSDNISDMETVQVLTEDVLQTLIAQQQSEQPPVLTVEVVQDTVEEILMLRGHHKIARKYIVYRENHKQQRQQEVQSKIQEKSLMVTLYNGETIPFDAVVIEERLRLLTPDLLRVSISEMVQSVIRQVYDGIPQKEIDLLVLGAARERIEQHYEYAFLASRIAINFLYKKILGEFMNTASADSAYRGRFAAYLQKGVELELLNPALLGFNFATLAAALQPERDKLFMYQGAQILIDRYLIQDRSDSRNSIELPQWFWMRVSMGLALKEKAEEREVWAIAFYNVLSNMDLISSTPTLFNSGTLHSQMSSCYLNIADDSLSGIFKLFSDNAHLSKWAGGIGSDWTPVRATGSRIKGTNGASQGVIPFIKIFNDVALAVNQGGKRKGAMCAYMEVWHLDYEQFLELKKNTGDERRRAHDINTAAWIPDLFMKRVQEDKNWTLFCPSDVPDLHDLYGKAFEDRYAFYESQNIPRAKTMKALDLWRKMLTMLYETGHPWITFKDAANVRNPQSHSGVIHSSNLCTEITLNTSTEETAVCNLASLNLAKMIRNGALDEAKIAQTVEIGIRMLDNVIDNNFYPIPEAEKANMRHRAVGLGLMGYQDALYQVNIAFDSPENLEFADRSMEMISYYAISGSMKLAKDRGAYETYEGSKWDQGIFPYDTLDILEEERGRKVTVSRATTMDWASLKAQVRQYGMRNSNTMAIAPTATIANIAGVYPCTEPAYKNIYMKENLSGNFLVINRYLIEDLEKAGLWTPRILAKIKLNNGSIQAIDEIPVKIRQKYMEIFEIPASVVVNCAARRGKWIDQSASTNIFTATTSGKFLADIYTLAWELGLKTTYYLRTLGASQVTKATVGEAHDAAPESVVEEVASAFKVCSISDPDCEACQ